MAKCIKYGKNTYKPNILFDKIRSNPEFFAKKHGITGSDVEGVLGIGKSGSGIDFNFAGMGAAMRFKNDKSKNYFSNLILAKTLELNGENSVNILIDTGWFKGTDGMWRMELDYNINPKEFIISDLKGNNEFKLEDIIDYPQLFELYPQYKDLKVVISSNEIFNDEKNGAFVKNGEINLSYKLFKNGKNTLRKSDTSILIHEIQHIIQGDEVFAKGNGRESIESIINASLLGTGNPTPDSNKYDRTRDFIEKRYGKDWIDKVKNGSLNQDEVIIDVYMYSLGEIESRNVQRRFEDEVYRSSYAPMLQDVRLKDKALIFDELPNVNFQIPAPQKPKNLMPKVLINQIGDTVRNGGKGADVMNVVQNSTWYKSLGKTTQENMTFADVKETLVDSDRYHKESDKVKAENKLAETQKKEQPKKETVQATQARNKNLVTERIKPVQRKPKNTIRNISDIISDVAKGLKSTMINAKPAAKKALGTYNPSSTLIRIKNASDLDTVAHELGHLLDDRFDIYGTIPASDLVEITKQLGWFADRGGSTPPKDATPEKKTEYTHREGIAEFIRAYVFNPQQAKLVAPELYAHFNKSIDQETKEVLKKYSDDVIDLSNASAMDKITAQVEIDFKSEKKNEIQDKIKHWFNKDDIFGFGIFSDFNTTILNSMSKANKAFMYINKLNNNTDLFPEKDFRVLNKLFNGVYGKIDRVLRGGLINGKNEFVTDSKGDRMNMEWLFQPLDATSEKTLDADMKTVISLLVSERTLEYVDKFERTNNLTGIGAGIDTDLNVAMEFINEFELLKNTDNEKYTRITEAARRYREYADKVLQYSVQKGRLSKEDYNKIKESNAFYVNLTRVRTDDFTAEEEVENLFASSKNITSVENVFKKAKGGTDRIRNPYESLLMTTANIIRETDRNEVMASFVEGLRKVRDMGDGAPMDLARIASKGVKGDTNSRKIFVDGQEEVWRFSKDIISAVVALEGGGFQFHWLGKAPAQIIRWTVTNFPVFAARNVTRDTVSRLVNSMNVSAGRDGIKGTNLLHNKSDRELFDIYGGSMGGYMVDKDMYKKHIEEAATKLLDNGHFVLHPKNWWKQYKQLLEKGENINRIAEFNTAYKKAKADGMDDYNAGLYAAFQARDLLDFATAGTWIRTMNQIIPFLNAGVQGSARMIRGAYQKPGAFLVKTAIFTILPTIIERILVMAGDDEDEFEQLPDYQRDFFWNFKTPYTGDSWISIPKPFESGLISSMVSRGISMQQGNKKAFDGATGTLLKSIIPVDESSWLGSFKPLVEILANKDFFRGGSIVQPWDENRMRGDRDSDSYASRAGQGISNILYKLNWDVNPNNVDHLIKGYGTYFGSLLLGVSDLGDESSRNKIGWNTLGFSKNQAVANAKNVKEVSELSKQLGIPYGKDMRAMRELQQKYYAAEGKEKTKLLNQIYDYADVLLVKFKEIKETKIKVSKLVDELSTLRVQNKIQPAQVTERFIKLGLSQKLTAEAILEYNKAVEQKKK